MRVLTKFSGTVGIYWLLTDINMIIFRNPKASNKHGLDGNCDYLYASIYTNSARTSHETHGISITEANRLMVFGENHCLLWEPHETQIYCSDRTSQEKYYVSAKEPNRLMLFEETVAVYCENHMEHTDIMFSSYLTGNITSPLQSPVG
jgi:hypothetical protein